MLAGLLGINRKRIYYQGVRNDLDLQIKQQIEDTHKTHPAYGHKRLAIELNANRKKILRVMHKYGIHPPRRKAKKIWLTEAVSDHHYTNLIKEIDPFKPEQIWVSDLTYLEYRGKFFYLETVEDIFTREILGAAMSDKHDSAVALAAIQMAIKNNPCSPEYFHFDQGRENLAQIVTDYLENRHIKISVSDKGSPWQNSYKESFFGRFKDEFGDINRFESLGELVEEVYSAIYYYNHLRIHTALKMPPVKFKQQYLKSHL